MNDLQILYQHFNKLYFADSLPVIPVLWNKRLRRSLGRCHYSKKRNSFKPLKIDLRWPVASDRLRDKTLIHEMCHLWALIHHNERGHGPYFWQKMAACGYPDGHRFDNPQPGEDDRYQFVEPDSPFSVGDRVLFSYRKQQDIQAVITRINTRTISIKVKNQRFRVSPSLLRYPPD